MDVPQLAAFAAVVDIGSFTRAAARLGLSQPTVTTRVKSLEQSLGTILLERLPGGVRPTPMGSELFPYAREIVALTDRAQQAVRSGGQPHGRLVVGTVESLTKYRLMPLVEYVYRRYPQMQVSLRSAVRHDAVTDVRDGRLDCAFFIDTVRDWEGVATEVLCPEPLVLVGSPDHLLAGRAEITAADLRTAPLLRAENSAAYHGLFERSIGLPGSADSPRVFELDSVDAVKESVGTGMGMALLPAITVRRELADGRLCPLAWTPDVQTYTQIAWRKANAGNAALTALIAGAVQVTSEQHDGTPGVRASTTPLTQPPSPRLPHVTAPG
ncbi:LysR family transcriptional regulator [Streptomyces apocyni]|uniref:LysR family transcriptional regulator n=1 Tax=Streptomyces apocyni TaxID=2654677 RepID=UPI0012E9D013|nr:LysR family transcriptional regulator [Streptomyces apocyni]